MVDCACGVMLLFKFTRLSFEVGEVKLIRFAGSSLDMDVKVVSIGS